jgi:hypothetical protein
MSKTGYKRDVRDFIEENGPVIMTFIWREIDHEEHELTLTSAYRIIKESDKFVKDDSDRIHLTKNMKD